MIPDAADPRPIFRRVHVNPVSTASEGCSCDVWKNTSATQVTQKVFIADAPNDLYSIGLCLITNFTCLDSSCIPCKRTDALEHVHTARGQGRRVPGRCEYHHADQVRSERSTSGYTLLSS